MCDWRMRLHDATSEYNYMVRLYHAIKGLTVERDGRVRLEGTAGGRD